MTEPSADIQALANIEDEPSTLLLSFEWCRIPAGPFVMGSTIDDRRHQADELPQHHLYLPRYDVSRHPVTNAQYAAFLFATGHTPPPQWQSNLFPPGRDDHPVAYVSWYDANAFCQWAAELTGETIRLPTEAEWEKAARGQEGRIFPWGDRWNADVCNGDSAEGPVRVGEHAAGSSPYGVCNMAGNIHEWTSSIYRPYPYDAADGREVAASDEPRVMRGGAWYGAARSLRCAARGRLRPHYRYYYVGFRVVRAPSS